MGYDQLNRGVYEHRQDVKYVFALRHDGTWERLTPDQITKEWV
ncbi:hypothetical protein [Streptomyces sp. NPDC048489]